MEAGQVTEADERAEKMSAPHDVPIRHTAPPVSTPTLDGSHQSPYSSNAKDVSKGSDVWAGAISRLQIQVQLNTSMLEQNRQKFMELEHSVQMLHSEMNGIRNTLHEVQIELRARPHGVESRRNDPRDLEILAHQVETVTNKANEVDSLRMQIDLLRNTVKRLEDHGSPAVSGLRPGTSSTHRESSSLHEAVPPPPPTISHLSSNPPLHQPLPPMRTASMSSADSRPTSLHASHTAQPGPIHDSQSGSGYHTSPHAGDHSISMHPPTAATFRPSEPLPPPSSLTGWRPADSMVPPASLPPPPPSSAFRPQSIGPSAGWAAVNAAHASKRPFEEQRPSPYESPRSGSPKRPKLAPLVPRSNYGEDSSYAPSSFPPSGVSDSPFASRSRAPSEGSQSQSQSQSHILPTPPPANMPGHRFIISTQDGDSQASWRPESERMAHAHNHGHRGGHGPHQHGQGHGPGRGRGRGLRGRGRRGRGGGGVSLPPGPPELGTPEWEKPGWTGSQVSPNGFYNPMHHHSPEQGLQDGLPRTSISAASVPGDREGEFPATPLAVQGPYDPFTAGHPDSAGQTSGGKKTRTKPIRNAEGVLIRKDGRPDMRSVSSANNLRKVHAKKEAERAEVEGRTPTSARSLAPAGSNPMSEDENDSGSPRSPGDAAEEVGDVQDTQERHHELMSKIFPYGTNSGGPRAAERFFPKHDHSEEAEGEGSAEPGSEEPGEKENGDSKRENNSQMTDVVMREMSEAQAEDHKERVEAREDTRMETVNEASEEQEAEKEK